jgi:uncharacterized membrane protein YccC
MTEDGMKARSLYAVAVGVLIFVVLTILNALHIGEHSVLRVALVAGLCAALVYWVGPKLADIRARRR